MTSTPAATRRARPLRRGLPSLLVASLLLCALAPHAPAAQSGRRKTERQSPVPQPTPGEAEPARAPAKNISIVATFIVYEDENVNFSTVASQRNIVGKSFYDRLRQSPSVEVSLGGRGTRGEARDRAKKETKSHVVLLQIEEDMMSARNPGNSRDRLGRTDPGDYAIRVSVYAPTTGDLKYNDIVHPRPYRSAGTVGGIPVPVPVGRLPGEYQLMQAARDAADRLLARFEIARPPEN